MVKKFLVLFVIILFLVSVCVWEEYAIHAYLNQIQEVVFTLQTEVSEVDNIDTNDFLFKVRNLQELWEQKEKKFCMVLNHNDVEEIGVEVARLMGAVVNNDKPEFNMSLTVLNFYINNLAHILGTSMQNLF